MEDAAQARDFEGGESPLAVLFVHAPKIIFIQRVSKPIWMPENRGILFIS
jgi:hypothetical protein